MAKQFVAGQLEGLPEVVALLAPRVNSYKRLVPGFEAPTYICWGHKNPSALIRVPQSSEKKTTRIEVRCPDISANPYLVFASLLKTGLTGIKKKMKVSQPIETNVFSTTKEKLGSLGITQLPASLIEAVKLMRPSKLVDDCLGEKAKSALIEIKQKEWE